MHLVDAILASLTVVVLLLALCTLLFWADDPRSCSLPGRGGGTSDVITWSEAGASTALSVLALILAAVQVRAGRPTETRAGSGATWA